jgi:hypothetical protein
MSSCANVPEATPPEPPSEPKIALPDKIVLWMFVVFLAGFGLILIGDLILGWIGR